MKSKFKAFKKNQIHELNQVTGGGITYKTNFEGSGGSYQRTDAWFLLEKNNFTGDGHTDCIC